ncbi:MAG: hypothetical protein A3F61_01040 [Candidatus Blackburnbacteria bacterium RIFCSPHIGHO2_12_FULL_41_13b]|uniref:Uncharacterized protein n=1 Tax=Candidatus Blackburnbacteria bacterium RIFCSPHIGHO2_12_FULL_41_13b TaxID=1797517 RepID=A0A1G1VA80_9BACT|nr:MAG: hypothetical protein A3F61_01040 [Candidatus Blackburnbacteria bacterium RIFCSPHIGHO2_12_FULL_41_13b]
MGKDFEPRYKSYSKGDLMGTRAVRHVPETPIPRRAPDGTRYLPGTLLFYYQTQVQIKLYPVK